MNTGEDETAGGFNMQVQLSLSGLKIPHLVSSSQDILLGGC
jgi:hypothetical protein